MSNVDNASIRYLMKEMDPSEELLMEREMLEDEDLLIEVESMRRTLQRLDRELPLVDPPAHLTEGIVKQAADREKSSSRGTARVFSLYRYQYTAAAAAVVIGLLGGLVWLPFENTEPPVSSEQGNIPSVASTSTPSSVSDSDSNPSSPQQSALSASSRQEQAGSESAGREGGVTPWIDQNEVIRFQDQFADEKRAAFDSIMNSSTQKLTPIDDPLQNGSSIRSLQLTGSE